MATWADTLKAAIGASAQPTAQQLGAMAAEDPTSFLGQKVVAVELQQPGLQFFSSAEQAAGTTEAVLQHQRSPSAADRIAPYFGASPYTMPIYAAWSMNQGGDTSAALRAQIEEAKKWATSSAGSATQRVMSGVGSAARQLGFGTTFPEFSGRAMPTFFPSRYQDSISAVLDSIRAASSNSLFRRPGLRIKSLKRVLTVEDL